jgi:hypothetical protein
LVAAVLTFAYLYLAVKGKLKDPIRMLPQIEAISDGVDKAVEEGKYVYVTPGNVAYLSGQYSTMTIAGMNVLRYTARLCVRKGAKVRFMAPQNAETVPLIDGIFKEVCVAEGHPEAYSRDEIRYYGASEASWATGAGADVASSGASLVVLAGACSSSENTMQEEALLQNALIIGGTPRYTMNHAYAIMADYPLFGDDVYAAGAICSGDPEVQSSLLAGDITKLGLIAALVVILVLTLAGVNTYKTGGLLNL